jgi:flagellar hook-basal body complex protein FliE
MPISGLSNTIGSLLPGGFEAVKHPKTSGELTGGFSDIFHETLQNAAITDNADKASQIDLLTGTSDDFSGLLLDAEKAEIALSLTVQIRDKVLTAYNEIMNMQV